MSTNQPVPQEEQQEDEQREDEQQEEEEQRELPAAAPAGQENRMPTLEEFFQYLHQTRLQGDRLERIRSQLGAANNNDGMADGGTGESGGSLHTLKCVVCFDGLAEKEGICACLRCGKVILCMSCYAGLRAVEFPGMKCPLCRYEWNAIFIETVPPGCLCTLIIRG